MRAIPTALPQPPAEMLISDVEQLKAVSDPLRLRLIEVMAEAPIRGWTAKELARRLAAKQTKLYHHIGILEERGFLSVAETRVVSGILEKRYRLNARSFRVDRALFIGPGNVEAVAGVLDAVFEKARNEILAGQRAGLVDIGESEFERRRMVLSASRARLSPTSVRRVMRLIERLDEIDNLSDPDGAEYGLVLAFYPLAGDQDR